MPVRQIIFALALLVTFIVFGWTISRIARYFSLTKPAFAIRDIRKRLSLTLSVAFGQTKIFRRPVIGFLHALVFWGFCLILFGSLEMVIDGLAGTERALQVLGIVYDILMAAGDIFALLVAVSIIIFLSRRLFFRVKRFEGIEMKPSTHVDANIALTMILLLMITLLATNASYLQLKSLSGEKPAGVYPVSYFLCQLLQTMPEESLKVLHEVNWWAHILLIFVFANILPYSKHFHVFLSVPNVFLSRLGPPGKLPNMDSVTREVRMMLDPSATGVSPTDETMPGRFGIKDIEDISWKNYLDSLSCTQCGRCTAVCPANLTGKLLSPRKIIMNIRERMKEKGPSVLKHGKEYSDNKSLLRDYITEEELWACTTCNACATECPVNINHPVIIVDMRRYLAMEEASVPGGLKAVFSNIENNGAPWQYSPEDRMLWSEDLEMPVQSTH